MLCDYMHVVARKFFHNFLCKEGGVTRLRALGAKTT